MRSLPLAALVLAATCTDVSAETRTIGANLNRAHNTNFDCTTYPGPDPFGNPTPYPSFATTCTWLTVGRSYRTTREGTVVPGGRGVVTRVRVRMGAGRATGPMRVVVLRSLRDSPGPAPSTGGSAGCCHEVGRSRVFTPRPGGVTTIATNLAVQNRRNPRNDLEVTDTLALSVLRPQVAVPVTNTGNHAPLGGAVSLVFSPAVRPGDNRVDGAGVSSGFITLLNATWVRR
jgi:hypothetical protein